MGGLAILDVSDPLRPRRVGGYRTFFDAEGLQVADGYAYMLNGNSLEILDVHNPEAVLKVASYGPVRLTDSAVQPLALQGEHAYVISAQLTNALVVLKVSDPSKPIGAVPIADNVQDLAVIQNHAFLLTETYIQSDHITSLLAFEISTPTNIFRVGIYSRTNVSTFVALQIAGDYAYVTDEDGGLTIVDINNPARPQLRGFANGSSVLGSLYDVSGVTVQGQNAYVTRSD